MEMDFEMCEFDGQMARWQGYINGWYAEITIFSKEWTNE